ncbi:uncharacterized protein [Euwallacea similis]|uniref:uncharacterized protein isoform X2 n=1 Tax=Euwallacea similis TaxID=1736056 RepID=UPI0034500334
MGLCAEMDKQSIITDKNTGDNDHNFHGDLNKQGQLAVLYVKKTLIPFGPNSVSLTCPCCHQYTITTIKLSASYRTHLIALFLCAIGCICCFWLPYTKDECKTTRHYCSHCNALLGIYPSR